MKTTTATFGSKWRHLYPLMCADVCVCVCVCLCVIVCVILKNNHNNDRHCYENSNAAKGNYNNAYTKVICKSLGGCLSYSHHCLLPLSNQIVKKGVCVCVHVWVLGFVTLTPALMPRIMLKLHVAYALKILCALFCLVLIPCKGSKRG